MVGQELASESNEDPGDHVVGLVCCWALDGKEEDAVEDFRGELRE